MRTVTSKDIDDVVTKLSSEKAKIREEGVNLLNNWLNGDSSWCFCEYLSRNTESLKPNRVPGADTWPFLVTLLMRCVSLEVSTSKRLAPKLVYAKALRNIVKKVGDYGDSGKPPLLLSVVRSLYLHLWETLKEVPSFELDYGSILCYLLAKKEYRFGMRKKTYCSLVLLYLEKVGGIFCEISSSQCHLTDKVFQTLHSLLKNPPGDFPSTLRDPTVQGFIDVFSNMRGDGKYLFKLLECLNTYLLLDGPNLGSQSLNVHDSVQHLVLRFWLTTSEPSSKDILIHYARLQLSLYKYSDENRLMEQIMDVVIKELDQSNSSNVGLPRKPTRNDAFESLSDSQHNLVELAALVFYKACIVSCRTSSSNKRIKKESAAILMKERLAEGKWLWNAVLCCLARKYGNRISTELFIYWLENICYNFERILNTANMEHAYDGLLWTLGSLQEFVYIVHSIGPEELYNHMHSVWSQLVHALPAFSSVKPIVETAWALLGKMVSNDAKNSFVVPQDIWDLQIFKQTPSASQLFFITSYFSRRGSHGDHRDTLHVRQNLLRSISGLLRWKDWSNLDEHMISLVPAAVYALCGGFSAPYIVDGTPKTCRWVVEQEKDEIYEWSVETITKLDIPSYDMASQSVYHLTVRLPRQIKDSLLNEAETCFIKSLDDMEIESMGLVEVFFTSAFISKYMYFSFQTRVKDGHPLLITKSIGHVSKLLDRAILLFQENINDVCVNSCSGTNDHSFGSTAAPLRTFLSSPFFNYLRDQDAILNIGVDKSVEKLLRIMVNLFKEYSGYDKHIHPESVLVDLSSSDTSKQTSIAYGSKKSRIVDVELDASEASKDGTALLTSNMIRHWKLEILELVSSFLPVLPFATWEILFDLMRKEREFQVRERILLCLCQHPREASSAQLTDLVNSIMEAVDSCVGAKLPCSDIITTVCRFIGALHLVLADEKGRYQSLKPPDIEQNVKCLAGVVDKLAVNDLLDWTDRTKLISCLCDIISISPPVGQIVIGRILTFLHDPDYRVRVFLARSIGILFRTWDGHTELFHDISSNFGAQLVTCSRENLLTAQDVLAAGPQPVTTMETIVVTLIHIALYSDKMELEAVFMTCAAAAIDPSLRELIMAALDNLSTKLHYSSRAKYFEELMGQIIFCWVTCGMNFPSLVGIRDLFVPRVEPKYFVQYCCHWLLPALIINADISNLKWIASVACEPLGSLVRTHFVPIFSVCMAMRCSKKSGWEKGAEALQSSILNIANMSESERDRLIKKHLVSIVGHLFSLAACSSDPIAPCFTRDAVILAIQTIVDGFMDMGDQQTTAGVIDRINVFRPDRVFMFLVEMHYRVTAAMHNRHKCHRLAGIEVLVCIIGNRAAVPSTYNYLFKLVGQHIHSSDLQAQCCQIISTALRSSNDIQSQQILAVLGEQLQFLVSILVDCCIPSEHSEEISPEKLSPILSLLHQLTVDSHPCLHEYIRGLEPFPEISILDDVRIFHQKLSQVSNPRDHFLKFVKRAPYLPPKLLLWSLRPLHKKLLSGELLQNRQNSNDNLGGSYEICDNEIVHAVWELVRLSASRNAVAFTSLVSDFLSRVGIGDPHSVVYHLPGESSHLLLHKPINSSIAAGINVHVNTTISKELLVEIIRHLKKYLEDDSAKVVDMASQALRGILSTERGQRALLTFDTYEKSIVEVHAKGIDTELVENLLLELDRKFDAEDISLEKSALWMTKNKSFDAWICPLVYSLAGFCSETILRFCQDLMMLKAELAELLLPSVFTNLARQDDLNANIQQMITSQLQDNIFVESNTLNKSVQVMLDALNELRILHVTEKAASYSTSRDVSKYSKTSSNGSKSRSSSNKFKEPASPSFNMIPWTSLWHKVYWVSLDYLLVAKSAIRCGSYFTSVMYLEYWCMEHSNSLTLGSPVFSADETLPSHIEVLVSAVTQINEPDSLYGIIQSHELTSQVITFEHEGNWNKALEYYDLQVRFNTSGLNNSSIMLQEPTQSGIGVPMAITNNEMSQRKAYKGLVRSLQQIGCTHVLDLYCQGLTSRNSQFNQDWEFTELQYEAAWRAGNWDFSFLATDRSSFQQTGIDHFNESLHSCLRALQEGETKEFHSKLESSKQELLLSVHHASAESTEYIYSTIVKLQIFDHLGIAWNLRWPSSAQDDDKYMTKQTVLYEPMLPTMNELLTLDGEWNNILKRAQLHMSRLEPFIAFRKVLLGILNCKEGMVYHLLQAASTLRKGSKFSFAAGALQELKFLCSSMREDHSSTYWLARLEEAKLLRAQGRNEMAINVAKYIAENYLLNEDVSNVYRLVGKWLAETRASNSRIILEKYLKQSVSLAGSCKNTDMKFILRQSQSHFHLAHYADALFRSYEERLSSNEWQAAMRLRKHKTVELEALIRRLKSNTKGDKTDLSIKIQELQKQLSMDREEAQKLQDDRDKFLSLALEGYGRCLVIGDKYDVRGVFRLVSLWFSLSARQNVVDSMIGTINEVQSYKFIPLAYQIASRIGCSKDGAGAAGPHSFQFAVFSLVKKMAIDHPYHTILQLLALANGDRIKDKQRSRNSFVVDMDKKVAAENLLKELASHHGSIIKQMRQMVEVYIRLAELETKREDTNKKVALPRDVRSVRQLELVPVVTSSFPVDRSCQYQEGSFPHFMGLADSVIVMNGINAPKVVECLGSDGRKYRQLAKSGNDDLRQDAVMEQFFGLVNTFLQNNRDTEKRRLGIRTYKVVPFTPSAGVLEWVDGTLPLGEYLIGSSRNGGAHMRYGEGDWSFAKCREHMVNAKDKRKAFQEVNENFRPVMHHFFLERFLLPADWFEKRLAYTRSVASSSMVGYIVGLGDRHSMNILIDQATAEVVHIDLGVAFEQGLMLKTPERVPFRLTRDIIDGMGVTGVEGVFRRCCEETLSVMRANKEALLTIVEVFIHDPLYKWALSPLKALQRQKDKEEDLVACVDDSEEEYEGNKDAARALMRVKQKLDGYEDGEMRSVHGQVQQLIQDAIDPERLSQMFPGWGAWL